MGEYYRVSTEVKPTNGTFTTGTIVTSADCPEEIGSVRGRMIDLNQHQEHLHRTITTLEEKLKVVLMGEPQDEPKGLPGTRPCCSLAEDLELQADQIRRAYDRLAILIGRIDL